MSFLNFVGDHPILTVIILIIVGGFSCDVFNRWLSYKERNNKE